MTQKHIFVSDDYIYRLACVGRVQSKQISNKFGNTVLSQRISRQQIVCLFVCFILSMNWFEIFYESLLGSDNRWFNNSTKFIPQNVYLFIVFKSIGVSILMSVIRVLPSHSESIVSISAWKLYPCWARTVGGSRSTWQAIWKMRWQERVPIQPIIESHRYRGIPYCFNSTLLCTSNIEWRQKIPLFPPRLVTEMFVPKVRNFAALFVVCCFALHDTQTTFKTGPSFESHVDKRSVRNISSYNHR